jgi:hypothetical protein
VGCPIWVSSDPFLKWDVVPWKFQLSQGLRRWSRRNPTLYSRLGISESENLERRICHWTFPNHKQKLHKDSKRDWRKYRNQFPKPHLRQIHEWWLEGDRKNSETLTKRCPTKQVRKHVRATALNSVSSEHSMLQVIEKRELRDKSQGTKPDIPRYSTSEDKHVDQSFCSELMPRGRQRKCVSSREMRFCLCETMKHDPVSFHQEIPPIHHVPRLWVWWDIIQITVPSERPICSLWTVIFAEASSQSRNEHCFSTE